MARLKSAGSRGVVADEELLAKFDEVIRGLDPYRVDGAKFYADMRVLCAEGIPNRYDLIEWILEYDWA